MDTTCSKGSNTFLITLPAVRRNQSVTLGYRFNQAKVEYARVTIKPVKPWTINFVQHAHTDIGYTRPQSEILSEHQRYIDYALDYCDLTDTFPDEARFRWTCESAWVVKEYLKSRPAAQIERLRQRIREGRVEVTGMFCNMAETADENLMTDFLRPMGQLVNSGIPITTVMQNDVNGIAWSMPDFFKHTSVRYLNMGINKTRSLLPFEIPTCFWWESPSGERLLAFRADHYMTGNFMGLESQKIKTEKLLNHLAKLDEAGYPFDKIAIQFSGYYTDNAPPSTAACRLIKEWNEKYTSPKLKLSTASDFFSYVEKKYGSTLPIYRKAWLDWWTDGVGSASRETAETRKTQNLKNVDEGLLSMVLMNGQPIPEKWQEQTDHIAENAIFYDEHTFGADESIDHPYSENTTKQWLQKGSYAWEATKMQTLLHETSLARLQPNFAKAEQPVIWVINSLGWSRSGTLRLFVDSEVLPLNQHIRIVDMISGAEVPAQMIRKRAEGAYWEFSVDDVPAMGAKPLMIERISNAREQVKAESSTEKLENKFYRIVLDKSTGCIASLYDKELQKELVDGNNPWKAAQPIHETMDNRDSYKTTHETLSHVKMESGIEGEVWKSIKLAATLKGMGDQGIQVEIRLYNHLKKIEMRYFADKSILTNPEALYVAFPFAMKQGRIVFETIGGTLSQGEQLPGSSTDWNAAQSFVAIRGQDGQIVITSNEIPLWQFSDLNMGKFMAHPSQGNTTLFSWVMNNYWFTNFRAYQEGGFSWSYAITSSRDTTNTFAIKFGKGENSMLVGRALPAAKSTMHPGMLKTLVKTGDENVVMINARPGTSTGSIRLHLREVDGKIGSISFSNHNQKMPLREINLMDALGRKIEAVSNPIKFNPYEVKFVEIQL
ncbi:MAG: hypothetical protein LWW85_07150 [Marinilabiliales bacterium]|nr:hypothetical protein [Marinilabiliales bacterium]